MPERVWRKGNSPTLLVGMLVGATTMEDNAEIPQKTRKKNKITIPGHISGENHNSKRYSHPYVYSSTISNSQDMEAT